MKYLLELISENIANERAQWTEDCIVAHVPKWKLNLLKKYNNWFLRKLIRADVVVIHEELIADFGTQIIVVLNGKVVGRKKFSWNQIHKEI